MQPAVSIGNVGQLAIDLLIANLPLELVGHIYDKDILPVSGNDAYGVQGRIITSADGMVPYHRKSTLLPVFPSAKCAFQSTLVGNNGRFVLSLAALVLMQCIRTRRGVSRSSSCGRPSLLYVRPHASLFPRHPSLPCCALTVVDARACATSRTSGY
jgi:hypothetical protein